MDELKIKQNADFLSIALECLESGSADVADEFVADVIENSEKYHDELSSVREMIDNGEVNSARSLLEDTYEKILEEHDVL